MLNLRSRSKLSAFIASETTSNSVSEVLPPLGDQKSARKHISEHVLTKEISSCHFQAFCIYLWYVLIFKTMSISVIRLDRQENISYDMGYKGGWGLFILNVCFHSLSSYPLTLTVWREAPSLNPKP